MLCSRSFSFDDAPSSFPNRSALFGLAEERIRPATAVAPAVVGSVSLNANKFVLLPWLLPSSMKDLLLCEDWVDGELSCILPFVEDDRLSADIDPLEGFLICEGDVSMRYSERSVTAVTVELGLRRRSHLCPSFMDMQNATACLLFVAGCDSPPPAVEAAVVAAKDGAADSAAVAPTALIGAAPTAAEAAVAVAVATTVGVIPNPLVSILSTTLLQAYSSLTGPPFFAGRFKCFS